MSPHDRPELRRRDLAPDPIVQFLEWFAEAEGIDIEFPNAMSLATADAAGRPAVRYVLLRSVDDRGFVFYTNHGSRKGRHLAENPNAALAFHWPPLDRQVNVTGDVTRLTEPESDAYFRTRPRESRIGAWASRQSEVVASREDLEVRVREIEARFPGEDVPRPPFWGGYLLRPETIEFWQGRPYRLHDRFRYLRELDGLWRIDRLSP